MTSSESPFLVLPRPPRTLNPPLHTTMRVVYPYVHTLIKSKLSISCTTASVEHFLSRWQYYKYSLLPKPLQRRTIELQFFWWFYIVMEKCITRNQYRTSCVANKMVNCSILKRLFSKYNAWLIFCSDNAVKIFEACTFQYEKFPRKNTALTRAELHFTWVYTFFAMLRSWAWQADTSCSPALPRNCVYHPVDCNLFKNITLWNSQWFGHQL